MVAIGYLKVDEVELQCILFYDDAGSSGSGVNRMSDQGWSLLPSTRYMGGTWGSTPGNKNVANPSGNGTKKVVRIPID